MTTLAKRIAQANIARAKLETGSEEFWGSSAALEAMQFQNLVKEFEQGSDLMYSIESLSENFFSKGESVSEYEAHLYQVSVEAALIAAGVDIPIEAIVPSFEAEKAENHKEEAKAKSSGLLKRAMEWLADLFSRLSEFFSGLWKKWTGKEEAIKSKVDDLKKKAEDINEKAKGSKAESKTENKPSASRLSHDKDAEKGTFVGKGGIKEKNSPLKHSRNDTVNPSSLHTRDKAHMTEQEYQAHKENHERSLPPLPKTIKVPESVFRTVADAEGKIGDILAHIDAVLSDEEKVFTEFDEKVLDPIFKAAAAGLKEGPGAEDDKRPAMTSKKMLQIGELFRGEGKVFNVTPVAKIVITNQSRGNDEVRLRVTTRYAYKGNGKNELPFLSMADVNKALGMFDRYETATSGGAADAAAEIRGIGSAVSQVAHAVSQIYLLRGDAVLGILKYLNIQLSVHSGRFYRG